MITIPSIVSDNRISRLGRPADRMPDQGRSSILLSIVLPRWQISDPLLYYNRLNDKRSALSRLDDILGSETRTAVASMISSRSSGITKGRQPLRDSELEKSGTVAPKQSSRYRAGPRRDQKAE